jgi:hypothetical protein
MYSRVRANGLGKGTPYHPSTTCGPEAPMPRVTRPPDNASSVSACMAVAAGVRADICAMDVPSLIRAVRAPYQVRVVNASEPYASAVHTESYPSRSAASTVSVASSGSRCQ